MTPEEERCLDDNLKWAARRQLGMGKGDLIQAVVAICNDGRVVPWDRAQGPGQRRVDGVFKRHSTRAEHRCHIYEVNRVSADDEGRMPDFYKAWKAFVDANNPQADHVWNTDETGDFRSICSVLLLS